MQLQAKVKLKNHLSLYVNLIPTKETWKQSVYFLQSDTVKFEIPQSVRQSVLKSVSHPYENSGRDAGEIRAIKSLADERYRAWR